MLEAWDEDTVAPLGVSPRSGSLTEQSRRACFLGGVARMLEVWEEGTPWAHGSWVKSWEGGVTGG